MVKLDKIAVGVDLGEKSLKIARWTAESFAPDAEMLLVYVVEPPPLSIFYSGILPSREKMVEAALEPAQEKLAALAAELAVGRVATETRAGRPAECIAAAAAEAGADLIVIGRHRREGWLGELGTTAEELFHFAKVPVLLPYVLPAEAPKTILMPIDDSKRTLGIMAWTRFLLEKYACSGVALHVMSQVLHGHLRLVSTQEKTQQAEASATKAARAWVQEMLQSAGFDLDRMKVDVTTGHTDQQILEAKERHKTDFIVMGSHGAGELERAVLGSVASTVTRHADCPVMVVLQD